MNRPEKFEGEEQNRTDLGLNAANEWVFAPFARNKCACLGRFASMLCATFAQIWGVRACQPLAAHCL
jgi:hypothetical protein